MLAGFSRAIFKPTRAVLGGCLLTVGSLVVYQILLGNGTVIRSENVGPLQLFALLTLGIIFLGLTSVFVGLTSYLRQRYIVHDSSNVSTLLGQLGLIIAKPHYLRIFTAVAVLYGLFFGIVSSTLVFQPGIVFSSVYGVSVPSAVPVLCCGPFGQMPQLVVYMTQQLAVLLVPENLILLFAVSWLVGLNAAVASYSYANRPITSSTGWVWGFGAIAGLFTVCPSCAGFFLMTIIGLGGAVSLALAIASLQFVFIIAGIPILVVAPIISLRVTANPDACKIVRNNPQYPIS